MIYLEKEQKNIKLSTNFENFKHNSSFKSIDLTENENKNEIIAKETLDDFNTVILTNIQTQKISVS